jgi:serine/threonine protein kinase
VLPAETRLNHYRILRPLGAGGMGEVYEASAVATPPPTSARQISRSQPSSTAWSGTCAVAPEQGDCLEAPLLFLDVEPWPHQREMLEKLAVERERHHRFKNLVVAATRPDPVPRHYADRGR